MTTMTTFSGNRALQVEEPLIFDLHQDGRIGVDLPPLPTHTSALGACARSQKAGENEKIGLPSLSESQVVRHYTRLSQKNFSIDSHFYPLGSCTMKHNPRLNEKMARLAGFSQLHPLQPLATVQGALALMDELSHWLLTLTGMAAISLSPAAGAHGELCGMAAIRAAMADRGEDKTRTRVLVPTSAHGTNPATAALCGFTVDPVAQTADGRVDMDDFRAKLGHGKDVAAMMLTNPNTCGLFERDTRQMADLLHKNGAYFYGDGANFNALVGRVRPGDLGMDCMHINLHKTFSTPHGGGGPGSGPVVFSKRLAKYVPYPRVVRRGKKYILQEHADDLPAKEKPFGRLKAFHGQMGMFVRALSYILSHGEDGLRHVSGDAVLNANYLKEKLQDVLTPAFPDQTAMHEVLFSDVSLKDAGLTTLDLAKALIDEGIHPMTIYFPLVVSGAMLVEPTETESRETLDQFIAIVRSIVTRARAGEAKHFQDAPHYAPRKRLDEAQAARSPDLKCAGCF